MKAICNLYDRFLNTAASAKGFGAGMMHVMLLVIFVWIGGLKLSNCEAEGVVPFVANSPFMSFFYTQIAPEYKTYKLKDGKSDQTKFDQHKANNTYGCSHALGVLIMGIGILTFLGFFFTRIGVFGEILVALMTIGTLSFLVTTPECWEPDHGGGEHGFPLHSGAGRLVIKNLALISGDVILLSRSACKLQKQRGESCNN